MDKLVDAVVKAAGDQLAADAERMVRAYHAMHGDPRRGDTSSPSPEYLTAMEIQREWEEHHRQRQAQWDAHAGDRARADVAFRRANERRLAETGSQGQMPVAAAMEWARPPARPPLIG